jgi:hypothetical protein
VNTPEVESKPLQTPATKLFIGKKKIKDDVGRRFKCKNCDESVLIKELPSMRFIQILVRMGFQLHINYSTQWQSVAKDDTLSLI